MYDTEYWLQSLRLLKDLNKNSDSIRVSLKTYLTIEALNKLKFRRHFLRFPVFVNPQANHGTFETPQTNVI
jgi:hypothetical protein